MKRKPNGDGSEYLMPNGRLRWRIYIEGKTIERCQRKNETDKQFRARYTKIKNDINQGTYIEKSKDTLYDILKRYIAQKFSDGIISESTYVRHEGTLKQIEKSCSKFIYKPIQKVKIENIEDSKSLIREYSQNCIDKIWQMLKTGFNIAYTRRKIPFNIMLDYTLTKPISNKQTKKIEALTIEEEKKLINILDNEEKDHKYRDIVKLQLMTGMRIGEVLARSSNNYNEKEHTFLIDNTLSRNIKSKTILGEHTKTYKKKSQIDNGKRLLPLKYFDNEVENIIIKHRNEKMSNMYGLLFWNYKDNTFIKYHHINSWLRRLNEKYKITNNRFATHVLRHTYITRLRESEVDMKIIQYLVGHVEGSPITNDVYTSVSDEFIKKELKKVSNI